MLIRQIGEFQALSATVSSISDEEYVAQKNALSDQLTQVLSLSADDVRRTLIPFSLQAEGIEALDDETIAMLPGVMSKYLVHNRSALTDARFLGFPFHYFYTAVFLLILFVGLCLIYCVRTDAMNKKLDMAD